MNGNILLALKVLADFGFFLQSTEPGFHESRVPLLV